MKRWLPLIGQFVDIMTTLVGLTYFGLIELNPLMVWLLDIHWGVFAAVKLGMGFAAMLISARYPWVLYASSAFGFVPAVWNIIMMLHA